MAIIRISTLLVVATIPILFASVQPWVCSTYSFFMLSGFLLILWRGNIGTPVFAASFGSKTAVGLFFALSLFTCLPIPPAVLSYLSPVRFRIISASWELTGNAPTWESLSYTSWEAFNGWVFLLSLASLFVVLCHLFNDRKTLKIFVVVMISIGLIEAFYGLMQALVPSMGVLWVDYMQTYKGYARGTYINRNHFAGFIEMIWPLALGFAMSLNCRAYTFKSALSSDRLNRQALMALGIVVLLLSLLFSYSRAGITGGLVGFISFVLMARSTQKSLKQRSSLIWSGIVVLLATYGLTIGVEPIIDRFLMIGNDGSRMDFWRDSLPIIKDHPLGIGLRNYETVFQVYNQSFISDKTVTFAHNDFLQLLIETGWIGFISIVGVYVIFLFKSARHIKVIDARIDPLRYYLAVGSFSGLISMTFHSFLDFNLQIPANAVYFVVLLAILRTCLYPNRFAASTDKPKDRFNRRLHTKLNLGKF